MLNANSIIEVVIAMTIIAVVVAIGSMIFVNINQTNKSLQEINDEGDSITRFINQSFLLQETVDQEDFPSSELNIERSESNDQNTLIYTLRGRNEKILWQFEILDKSDEK